MNETNKENKMNEVHGVIVNHEWEVEIHSADCKQFTNPRLSVHDRMSYDSAYKDKFVIESDLDDVEYRKSLLCLISDNFWGGYGTIASLVFLKCTGKVKRKTFQDVGFTYDEINDPDYYGMSKEEFKTYVNKTKVIAE